ncbi:serine protease snake-like [Macrosteles quadrilineatus]|uniref:serine protease snake-like n=1 Tax=Macrosteles quadrilineatus TaxID=74068 RepID=UPI0023E11335|nr:serine protease snake-like [Macrosteles quadrilineatus]
MKAAHLVVIISIFASTISQRIAKLKCLDYSLLAKQDRNSPLCHIQDDKSSGVKIEPNEFPGSAMLGFNTTDTEVLYLCDATLISEDTLIAPGHCVKQPQYGKPTWVRLGATYSTLGVEVEVKESLCHPQYNPGHDIALIKLKQRLNSSYIPACLDTEGVEPGAKGVGVGRPIGSAYVELREKCPVKSWLEVKPASTCNEVFPSQNISSEATLCTKDPANGPGDCLSGPLYVFKESCVLSVAGLASFGKICLDETSNGRTPSVYTKVAHYVPWIESIAWPSE